jgi:hypothetical protein
VIALSCGEGETSDAWPLQLTVIEAPEVRPLMVPGSNDREAADTMPAPGALQNASATVVHVGR